MRALLKSEMIKEKHSAFSKMHVWMPVLGILIFLGYFVTTDYSAVSRASGFFQLLSMGFIMLISVVCAMNSSTERDAGNYFHLLCYSGEKGVVFSAKAAFIILHGLLAVCMVSLGMGIGDLLLMGGGVRGLVVYLAGGLVLFLSNLFLYLFHLFLSLRFGNNISIAVGAVGSLMAAMMILGLGDMLWIAVPCAWGIRLTNILVGYAYQQGSTGLEEVLAGIGCCAVSTVVLFFLVKRWFVKWEGNVAGE